VLASLLPGLRELRTPLAAGYLYLLSLFLLLADRIPAKPHPQVPLSRIYDVVGWIGKPAILAVSTFVAYLVGSVLEWRAETVSRQLRIPRYLISYLLMAFRSWKAEGTFLENAGVNSVAAIAQLAKSSVDTLEEYVEDRLGRSEVRSHELGKGVGLLALDLPQVRIRLYGADKHIYGDYDRLASEADLKVNVGLAAVILSVVAAIEVTPLWALLSVPMGILIYRGLSIIRQANDVLVQAIVAEVVKSPRFEQYIADRQEPAQQSRRLSRIPWVDAIVRWVASVAGMRSH
jgi:hypothetical protein